MRKTRFNKKSEKSIMKYLDGAAKKFGLTDTRHAANKWVNAQRIKASLAKAQKALEAKLQEVNRKLAN